MTTQIAADAAGMIRLGDLDVPRLGFGALRLPGPGVWGPFNEALDVRLDLQPQSKIGCTGPSNVTAGQVSTAQARTPTASVSSHLGPAEQSDAVTLDMRAARGVTYPPFIPLEAVHAVTATGNALGAVAAKHDATPAQLAIARLLATSPAMVPIPGRSKAAHLEDNVAAASLRLHPHDLAELAAS